MSKETYDIRDVKGFTIDDKKRIINSSDSATLTKALTKPSTGTQATINMIFKMANPKIRLDQIVDMSASPDSPDHAKNPVYSAVAKQLTEDLYSKIFSSYRENLASVLGSMSPEDYSHLGLEERYNNVFNPTAATLTTEEREQKISKISYLATIPDSMLKNIRSEIVANPQLVGQERITLADIELASTIRDNDGIKTLLKPQFDVRAIYSCCNLLLILIDGFLGRKQ
ncbi:MAG: hypothetical protein SFT91_01115 [Rickettsiaceae bacterium]|nr:hypothetical protein [Rickettsiaceae bacterium]